MRDEKIEIRLADLADCKEIFDWRSDALSRSMFFSELTPTFEEHKVWFENSLLNVNRTMYVGDVGATKIGVCRFDFFEKESLAEVSINMNPESRGRGLGKRFLAESIECYLKENKHDLLAKVKPNNVASLKAFEAAGFEAIASNVEVITLIRKYKEIAFKEVGEDDADVLFELLKRRTYSISHLNLPTKDEHLRFVKSMPYRHWAIVIEDGCPIGSYYIQFDNSIGLNLLHPTRRLVLEIFRHIRDGFEPVEEIKSKVPSYFYVNVSYANKRLKEILLELNALPIQMSYKI